MYFWKRSTRFALKSGASEIKLFNPGGGLRKVMWRATWSWHVSGSARSHVANHLLPACFWTTPRIKNFDCWWAHGLETAFPWYLPLKHRTRLFPGFALDSFRKCRFERVDRCFSNHDVSKEGRHRKDCCPEAMTKLTANQNENLIFCLSFVRNLHLHNPRAIDPYVHPCCNTAAALLATSLAH